MKKEKPKNQKFEEFLEENNIACFFKEEIQDEIETVVYRSAIEVEDKKLDMIIILDDSIYSVLRIKLATDVGNTKKIIDYINKINRRYKAFKYYLGEDKNIYLDSVIPSVNKNFDSELIYTIINITVEHLLKEYPSLIKIIKNN